LLAHPGSVFDESFRSVRTALKIGQDGQLVRSLAISSALPDEGKTTAAICLARSAALAGLRVLLLDCDLRRRASSRTLADRLDAGLVEVLKGEVQLEQAIVRDAASGAHFLPQKPSSEPVYDLIASRAMGKLIERLEESYDLVIIDTAPVLPVAEARAVAAMADGVLLVVRWRKTPANAAKLAVDQLRREGANLSGAMLSRIDLQAAASSDLSEEAHYYRSYALEPARLGYGEPATASA
jgi:capsular exopolysaccharide synthesis family protein